MKNIIKEKLAVICLPIIMYLIVGPLEIYCSNISSFKFTWRDFVPLYIALSIILIIFGLIIIRVLPKKIRNIVCMLIFAGTIISYVQTLFLNFKLREETGGPMIWDKIKGKMYLNLVIWIVLFLLIVIFYFIRNTIYQKVEKYGSIFLVALHIITAIFLCIQAIGAEGDVKKELSYALSNKGQFEVAANDNVIIFILDCTGNAQIRYTEQYYPDLLEPLNDFTQYTNANSGYCATFPAMTFMFTGNRFDLSEESCVDWLEHSWTSDKTREFYKRVHDSGYRFNMYSADSTDIFGDMGNMIGLIDNVDNQNVRIDHKVLFTRLTKLSLYKYVPYVAKPRLEVPDYLFSNIYIYENFNPAEYNNGEFYELLKEEKLSVVSGNSVIVQHLRGGHPDYRNLADGSPCEENGSNLQDSLKGCMVMLDDYFNQMKALGIYDNATIIITADHGIYELAPWIGEDGSILDSQPIFFVKKAGEKHKNMLKNSSPIDASDIIPTILYLVGEEYQDYGTTIWEWDENDNRERFLLHNEDIKGYKSTGGFRNAWSEYIYNGKEQDLIKTIENGPDKVYQAIDWK